LIEANALPLSQTAKYSHVNAVLVMWTPRWWCERRAGAPTLETMCQLATRKRHNGISEAKNW